MEKKPEQVSAFRLRHVHAWGVKGEDAVIIELTVRTGAKTGELLQPFFVTREQWSDMVSIVSTAFALPDQPS